MVHRRLFALALVVTAGTTTACSTGGGTELAARRRHNSAPTTAAAIGSSTTASSVPSGAGTGVGEAAGPAADRALLASLTVEAEHRTGYSRDLFKHWTRDAQGCDTRERVLRAESLTPAQVDYPCKVVAGDWLSAYDNVRVTNPGELDVDHVVALGDVWVSGGWKWDAARREAYANDDTHPETLRAVTAHINREKSDKDAANWLPPYLPFRCQYVHDVITVKHQWGLSVDAAERDALGRVLTRCGADSITTETTSVTAPTAPSTTTLPAAPAGPVVITGVTADTLGNDVQPDNSEYATLHATADVDVSGWQIVDAAHNTLTIGAGIHIASGADLRVHTGPGTNTTGDYFCGRNQAVFNNDHDSIALIDPQGNPISTFQY
ncbi:MAG TPA: lamin tail domain-containing protein [Acidimicrobiales bacterium]|nr:lamin tail domain-containing protein [Acidimicrobiales bacterium]